MFLTDEARYMGHASAFEIPFPAWEQPAKRLHDAVMLGSLPPRVRELYGLSYGPRQRLAYRAGVATLRAGRMVLPDSLAHGSVESSYRRVAATERRRIERGQPTPQVPANAPAAQPANLPAAQPANLPAAQPARTTLPTASR
jgi:hypothetical protein